MQNILSIDVEDYFQVSAFASLIDRIHWDHFESRVERNTLKILEVLSLKKVHGTFFVLGWVAERCPELVRAIHANGHEIGSHGYSHKLIYDQTPEEFRKETHRSKALLEDTIGAEVVSYRAASYSITRRSLWALDILAQAGFRYDSSLFPIVHDRYGIPQAPRQPFRVHLGTGAELVEFPMSTLRLLGMNLPIAGGGYFRLYPYAVTRLAIQRLNRGENLPLVFYLHPWEFDPDQPIQNVRGMSRFRHYLNLERTAVRFSRLISDFAFAPLVSVASELELIPSCTLYQLNNDWGGQI